MIEVVADATMVVKLEHLGRPEISASATLQCPKKEVCVCVCVCVCMCVCAVIFNRAAAGSILDDYDPTRLSSLSQTPPDFSFILLGGYQQPVHAGVCGVMRVRGKMKKRPNK